MQRFYTATVIKRLADQAARQVYIRNRTTLRPAVGE